MQNDTQVATRLQRAALLTFSASLYFWAFFQISKRWGFAAVNPFAEDPVDAIGSIAVQVALAVSLLTLARAAPASHASAYKSRLVVRGCSLALLAIAITLSADMLMELQHPTWSESIWGMLLIVGWGAVAAITCVAVWSTVSTARRLKISQDGELRSTSGADALGEALDDLWSLARTILSWISQHVPGLGRPLRWIDNLGNRLFEWMMNWPLIGPRSHPWRFCASGGLVIGIALAVVHGLEEGPSIGLALTLLVSSIFIGVEFVAVLGGYLILGGFLGLRPPLRFRRS